MLIINWVYDWLMDSLIVIVVGVEYFSVIVYLKWKCMNKLMVESVVLKICIRIKINVLVFVVYVGGGDGWSKMKYKRRKKNFNKLLFRIIKLCYLN